MGRAEGVRAEGVRAEGVRAETVAELRRLGDLVRPLTLAEERILPVLEPFVPLLPEGGLRRGTMLAVEGHGAVTSLALALVAAATARGSWVAVVGAPWLGLAAADEVGVRLDRLLLVDAGSAGRAPGGSRGSTSWATVVAALVDAVDVVVLHPPRGAAADLRRLVARARERGAVLVTVADPRGATSATRPRRDGHDGHGQRAGAVAEGADVCVRVVSCEWIGVGRGHGHLRARRVTVTRQGRRGAARPAQTSLWLPDPDGRITTAVTPPASASGPSRTPRAALVPVPGRGVTARTGASS